MLLCQIYDTLSKKPFGSTFEADSCALAVRTIKNSMFSPKGERLPGIPYLDLELRVLGYFNTEYTSVLLIAGEDTNLMEFMHEDFTFIPTIEKFGYLSYPLTKLLKD